MKIFNENSMLDNNHKEFKKFDNNWDNSENRIKEDNYYSNNSRDKFLYWKKYR